MSKESETRIEQVLEGVEALARAAVAKDTIRFRTDGEREMAHGAYANAREELGNALRAFVAPVVRIVEGGLANQVVPFAEKKPKEKLGVQQPETYPTCHICDCPLDPGVLCCEKNCPKRCDGGIA